MEYSLDIEELKEIPFDKYEKDFSFIVNGKEFKTNRFLADLLSPLIRRSHYQDSSLNTFIINKNDIDIDNDELNEYPLETYFSEFLTLSNYSTNTLDEIHQQYYSIYFYALGNIKEYFRLRKQYFEGITKENVIKKIEIISKIETKFNNNIKTNKTNKNDKNKFDGYFKLIEFASENFEELDAEEMKDLRYEDLEEIIKNENLQLDNEDSLMKFILKLYEEDNNNSNLLEYVIFRNLSNEMIENFIKIFDIEHLDQKTWISICKRLTQQVQEDETVKDKRYNNREVEFQLDSNNRFNGILKYLSDSTGGNIIDNGKPSCKKLNYFQQY